MPIRVIPGVELTSREEVHLLAYFPDIKALLKMEKEIDNYLPGKKNNSRIFGNQLYYNLKGEIIGIDDALRQIALNIGLDNLVEFIHSIEGIAVPAHIDKDRFSLFPVIAGSDSHGVEDIGLFFIEDNQEEIKNFTSLKDFLRRSKQQ